MSEEVSEGADLSESVESSESFESSESSSESGSGEVETSSDSGAPDFDFTGWDGSAEQLPSMYHPVYSNIQNRVQSEVEGLRNSLTADRELYQALLEGEDVGQQARQELAALKKEFESAQTGKSDWETQKAEYERQITEFQGQSKEREKTDQADADRWAQDFESKHQSLLNVPESREKFLTFLGSGFTPETSVELTKEGNEGVVNSTVSYVLQGVPEQYALRMARADNGRPTTEAAKPRISAQITAGASATANMPDSAEKGVSDKAFNIRDARKLAVSRAFKRRAG